VVAVPAAAPGVVFTDIAASSGITFRHNMSKTGQVFMVETMGSGAGLFDHDLDGYLDVYLVDGAPLPGYKGPMDFESALYRSEGGVRFTDVTAAAGIGNKLYGQGVCAGDYDNDGYPDLYAADFGPNVLYHNEGDGRFRDVTAAAGVGDPQWGSSCTFFDQNLDGMLDLFVVNYVDHTVENNKFCGDYAANVRAYCHPNVYNGQRDILYRNNGDGTFRDATEEAGLVDLPSNGLGVVTGDYDNDGDLDVYVANDKTPNLLWRNDGTRFTDIALLAGVGFGLDGSLNAGMGTDFGDYDGDGDLDIVVTNLDFENNSLYRNEGRDVFSDVSFQSGIGGISLSYVGFGARFVDYDNDGWLDLFVANGHILDNAAYFNDATTYAQRNFVHRNRGDGTFEEVGLSLGPDMALPNVARGLAVGDVDLDGDLDVLLSTSDGPARLFRNDGGNARASLLVRLAGTASNRDAVGARVTIQAEGRRRFDEVKGGSSYQSQSDTRIHFGLGAAAAAEILEVRWPGGRVERFEDVAAGRITIVEGEGRIRR
jgi:hypothetical protein